MNPLSTFVTPPLDGSLSILQIYDFHLLNSPQYPLFRYRTTSGIRRELTWSDVVLAIHGAAISASENIKLNVASPTVVGVLAVADSVSYIIQIFGIMRAGFIPFPISTRNSPTAVRHLISKTGAKHVYVSRDKTMSMLLAAALDGFPENDISVISMPSFDEFFIPHDCRPRNTRILPPIAAFEMTSPSLILHSSGTTAFPKPITYTHFDFSQFARLPLTGEMGVHGQVLAMHAIPMFHAMGISSMSRAAAGATILAVFEPQWPPILPSVDKVLCQIVDDECTIAPCVPSFLETWSSDPEAVKILASMKAVVFSGGPLNEAVGDLLADKGVPLFCVYGGTEAGSISMTLPDKTMGKDWQYFPFAPYFEPHLVPWGDGVFELFAMDNGVYTPIVVDTCINGRKAYATKDLLIRHPTDPTLWKVYGRSDDQIMLSTGEKTNPGPIETIFYKDPRISGAVMFGRGHPNNGILLELKEPSRFKAADEGQLAAFRLSISHLVEEANAFAPSHSRLYPEMILIADSAKAFELTPKGSPRRHSVLAAYHAEIEAAYISFEQSSSFGISPPDSWEHSQILIWIQNLLWSILGQLVPPQVDIFQLGCDSLQATRIRNIVASHLRKSVADFDDSKLSPDFVYHHPSAKEIASFLEDLVRFRDSELGPKFTPAQARSLKLDEMENLVAEMAINFKESKPRKGTRTSSEVILLTGTTGALGSHLLANLHRCPDVSRIFAFNRGDKDTTKLRHRQEVAMASRGIDSAILDTEKIILMSGDLAEPGWNIEPNLFEELLNSVTLIIHTAWPVNFTYTLGSFRKATQGVRSLLEFAQGTTHSTTPRLIFTSSISVLKNWPTDEAIPEVGVLDPTIAVGLGYAESKWVAERILEKAAETGLQVSIIRIGQLSGSQSGAWNSSEWFPSIVQAGRILGCLPMLESNLSWLPVDLAAAAIVDMKHSSKLYIHLAHPIPVSSLMILRPISAKLSVPLVPFHEWLECLKSSPQSSALTSQAHLAAILRLQMMVKFFNAGGQDGALREQRLVLDNALASSPTLSQPSLRVLGDDDVARWLQYWNV